MEISINYNPYIVSTELLINGKSIDQKSSPLAYICDKRLQNWIEPKGNWKGFFRELRSSIGESNISVKFTGTFDDFDDLVYAKEHFGNCFESIDLIHENKDTAMNIDPHQKLRKLQELYQQLQAGPVDEFKTEQIKKNFDTALNSDFRIVIVAPMSSGKSTLINSILGKDLLPAINQATTAVITEVRANPKTDHFIVSAQDKYGNLLVKNQIADQELIKDLNSRKDPNDPESKKSLLHYMKLEGPIPNLHSDDLHAVFIDTPGGNNAQNKEHRELMDEALRDESKSIILYIFDGAKPSTDDGNVILHKIADSIKLSNNGKQSKDRFLFIANQMDKYDPEKEPFEGLINNTILPQLSSVGITEPNLFLISALTAKLVRLAVNGEPLDKIEKRQLNTFTDQFNDEAEMLPMYASLNAINKEQLIASARKYMETANAAENETEKIKNQYKAAEINSGIPAVEMAINEYLDKYAIPIKIKNMHDSFMKKVNEQDMIRRCEEEWSSSKNKLEEIQKEVREKWEAYQHNTKLQEYRDKVMSIRPNFVSIVRAEEQSVSLELSELLKKAPDKLPIEEAEHYLKIFQQNVNKISDTTRRDLDKRINFIMNHSIQNIVKEYAQCIKELDSEGFFNIGKYNMKQLVEFNDILIDTEHFTLTEKVKTGTKTIEKDGLFSIIARLLGFGGYETIDTFEDQSFVLVKDLISDQAAKIQQLFVDAMENHINDAKNQIEELKSVTLERLNLLDEKVRQQMIEIQKRVQNQKQLEKEVKDNFEKTKWIKNYVEQVENLLSI